MLRLITTLYCMFWGNCSTAPCAVETVSGIDYAICRFNIEEAQLKLVLGDDSGKAYGSVGAFRRELERNGQTLKFAMNGGMYHHDLTPVGLYVENGVEKKRISTKGGRGNFHLLPNGVFYFDGSNAGVLETKQYLAAKITPAFATQSGPMLVINGALHPRFLEQSDSLKIRNGVGVAKDGKTVIFAISRAPVRFWDFGVLFQDHLQTPNALFLDGSISTLWTPTMRQGGFVPLGPIIAVVDK